MKLLFDENLSPKLAARLVGSYPESCHADAVGLHARPDREVWRYAALHGFVLVSKDDDFRELSFLRGHPPKVVWLRVGNAGTAAIAALLESVHGRLETFVADPEESLLELELPAG